MRHRDQARQTSRSGAKGRGVWRKGALPSGGPLFPLTSLPALALLLLLHSAAVEARTWRVAKDGSGDFSVIQPAVDAASPGDTVAIGPGRYTEHFTTGMWGAPSREACVVVAKDDLTIRGDDSETVIIGPESYEYSNYGPIGLGTTTAVSALQVEELGLVNSYINIWMVGGAPRIKACRTAMGATGLELFGCNGATVDECHFADGRSGIFASSSSDVFISNCHFSRAATTGHDAIDAMLSTGVCVTGCEITDSANGIAYHYSSGEIRDCDVRRGSNLGLIIYGRGTDVSIEDCTILDSPGALYVDAGAVLSGVRNTFQGSVETFGLRQGTLSLHDGHILNGGGWSVKLYDDVRYNPGIYDLTGNWWGTIDSVQIDAWVYDANDRAQVGAIVQYVPYEGGPVRAETKTWGGIKGMFR